VNHTTLKHHVTHLPGIGPLLQRGWSGLEHRRFHSSGDYWERRYRSGGRSGAGSYGRLARFKADFLNALVADQGIATVVEWGCGDGAQLALAEYPDYLGIDVSPAAVDACRARFADDPTKRFSMPPPAPPVRELALSLDVTYHLVEDDVFDAYLGDLFASARRYVVLYTSDAGHAQPNHAPVPHIRHRPVNDLIASRFPGWALHQHVENAYPYDGDAESTSFADFFVYRRR
jgi:hypothetical protein